MSIEHLTVDEIPRIDSASDTIPNQQTRNQAAIQLLDLWCEGDEHEQKETWEFLKVALDEDRLSDRKLFS